MGTTVNIICYTSKCLANGEHPLMIRVIKDRTRKYKSLGISLNKIYWDFGKNQPKVNCPNRELIEKIIADRKAKYLTQILTFKAMNREFTAATLVENTENPIRIKTVNEIIKDEILFLKSNDRLGNMNMLKELYDSMIKFNKHLHIYFYDIDECWLINFELFLRNNKLSDTTISIRFRTLRALFNQAIREKNVEEGAYPFKKFRLARFEQKTLKRSISKEDIHKLINYNKQNLNNSFPIDVFIFSYLMGGINFVDIAHLKEENVIEGKLAYVRRKTKKTIILPIHPIAETLINKYRDKQRNYLFPILSGYHITEIQKNNRVHKVISNVNKKLKIVGNNLAISTPLTTYVARHTFATVLKRSGVSIPVISESLGHSSEKITQVYLNRFENDQIIKAMENLI